MKKNRFALKVLGSIAALGLVLGVAQLAIVPLASATIIPTTPAVALPSDASHLVAWYKLTDVTSSTLIDSSGNGNNGSFPWNIPPSSPSTGTCMNAITNYATLPSNLLAGLSSITLSIDVNNPGELGAEPGTNNYSLFTLGQTSASLQPNGYLYMTTLPTQHAGITLSGRSAEQVTNSNATVPSTGWHVLTYTYNAPTQTASLYLDGTLVGTNSAQTITPGQLFGPQPLNVLGASANPTTDGEYDGCMKDFRIYNTALSATQVASISTYQSAVDADAASLSLTDLNDVRGDLYLPSTLADGATVSWSSSNPAVIDNTGLVNRPSANTSVTLTATVSIGDAMARDQFTANVIAAPARLAPYAGYLFAYFTGDTTAGENLYMAVSNGNDILHYTPLNNGKPIFVSHFGSGGLRDSSIVRSPDGDTFYLIATDLSIGSGTSWAASQTTGSQYIEVWKSHNLVDWTQQAHTLVSLPTAGNTWAPDAIWDPAINEYVVYWASELYSPTDPNHLQTAGNYNRMMYSETRDFVNFTTPQVWQDPGGSRIDAAVTYNSANGTYYRFTKDEGAVAPNTGCSDILEEKSSNLLTLTTPTAQGWTTVDTCIGRKAGIQSDIEAPIIVKSNPNDVNNINGQQAYYLFVDNHGGNGYIPLTTSNIDSPNWQQVTTGYTLPGEASGGVTRHGGILPITAAEMTQLQSGPTTQGVPNYSPILNYNFAESGGTTVHDTTGNGFNGTAIGGATLGGGSISFNGTNGYVLLPNNLMARLTNLTVDADVYINPSQASPYMLYALGNTDVNTGKGSGYLFATGDPVARGALTPSDWTQEQSAAAPSALPRGQWVRLTYTVAHDWANHVTLENLYVNGQLAAQSSNAMTTSISPGEVDLGYAADDYIGRSLYSTDNYFSGQMKSFTMWNYALSPSQVAALGAP